KSTGEVGTDIAYPAIDPRTERLYLVFTDGRWSGGRHSDVSLVSSGDSGRSWTGALRVPLPQYAASWLPAIALDGRGRVGVAYTAIPNIPSRASDRMPVEVWSTSFTLGP